MMRQQGRYHCGWWPMVKLSLSADKRVDQWIASRNQRWKWNSTRTQSSEMIVLWLFHVYFPWFSDIFLYVPLTYGVFPWLFRCIFPAISSDSFANLWRIGRCHKLIAAVKTQEDADSVPEPTMGRLSVLSWRTLDSQSLWRSCRAAFDS